MKAMAIEAIMLMLIIFIGGAMAKSPSVIIVGAGMSGEAMKKKNQRLGKQRTKTYLKNIGGEDIIGCRNNRLDNP